MFAFYNRWKYLFYVVIRVYKMGTLVRNGLNNFISDFWYIRMGYIDFISKQSVHNIIWINGSRFAVCKVACKMSTKMRSSSESQKRKLRGVIYSCYNKYCKCKTLAALVKSLRSELSYKREFQLCTIKKYDSWGFAAYLLLMIIYQPKFGFLWYNLWHYNMFNKFKFKKME